MSIRRAMLVSILTLAGASGAQADEEHPFEAPILDVRPRIFIRRDPFEGLTVEKLRQATAQPEFAGIRDKWRARGPGRAILWMLDGNPADLQAAIDALRKMQVSGQSWSDKGISAIQLITQFDWLYTELDAETRRAAIAKIERAADDAVTHIRRGLAPYYYSRTPGALACVALSGIGLQGVSPKADEYLQLFRQWGVNDYFRSCQWVDGAATGATYTLYYTYVDLPSVAAAWWSATGRNPQEWLRRHQADWLDGIVRFYLWSFRPGFAFPDINDQSRDTWGTHDQFCQGLDIASYLTRNGYGRAWSQRWLGRCGSALYHPQYAHNFIFRDPSLEPKPLTDLPLAALFGRESCGYGFFRSDWPAPGEPDTATHVFFRCGDPLDVHGGVSAGEFQIFKHAPLAGRGGHYASYDSAPDQYHRNCISTNVVLLTDPAVPGDRGDQNTRRGLKSDHQTWADWLEIRQRNQLDVAQILDWQLGSTQSRCRADLTKTSPAAKCRQWIREFVWLANRHLVVLDVIETARPEIRRQWQLHAGAAPEIGERILTVVNRPPRRVTWADATLQPRQDEGRLFCQTLLPRDYRVILHTGGKAESFDARGQSLGEAEGNTYHRQFGQHVVQIEPQDTGTRSIFLHVLTATVAAGAPPPPAAWRRIAPGAIELRVEDATATLQVPEWFESKSEETRDEGDNKP